MNTTVSDKSPPLLSTEFDGINRYWDHSNITHAAKILPGEYYVSAQGELITTVLGSCVAACIRDRSSGVGGMNHFMLPHAESYKGNTAKKMLSVAGRYGNVAMEKLINCILSNGGNRDNLEFKIFGGARVLDIDSEVGYRNIQFVTEYLKLEEFRIEAEDVGGVHPRKVNYFPETGKVMMKKLKRINGSSLKNRELRYHDELDQQPIEGDVTFFTK
ncbi:MAG: chemoreceptor glutamine deamidase CheD [Pseudomonadales bacterium]|nr:chemoreceptor glutamine deamidase CheD [Pseudomonadales bacterium]MBO6565759.1 chemoreceptor glutamine deamidase CheD [Pseudomonadales bacterium]MBO6597004.1 chemoreceptor glutamine deamidase CheD [Pseudomonadales bacterium]MBO6657708.1 chemoreceptor glutamine deamidase CheD [Pseudomonadales bacterium]MBO6703646.1 chemoreceptor glutamine deamidase CheD [Pseudomonadales bacterium]